MAIEVADLSADELPRWLEIANAVRTMGSVDDMLDWRRQSEDMAWLLATADGVDAGAGIAIVGWHAPPGVGRSEAFVLPAHRGRGVGTALFTALATFVSERGCVELDSTVKEDDPESVAWAERHGYREIGRTSKLVLDLTTIDAPAVDPPAGIEVVRWADHPELAPGMYAVAVEAYPDAPGEDDAAPFTYEEWISNDMSGHGDRPDATFVALAGDDVVGYAKLSLSTAEPEVAHHDMTGVLRAWRGRGVAGALKRAEIAWAKGAGYRRLETQNEERNEPIRRLNQRHGYVAAPGYVVMRAAVSAAE